MKKLYLLIILLLTFCLVGCGNSVEKIEAEDITCCIEIFDISEYNLKVFYNDGTEEEIALSAEMISSTDLNKLKGLGTHEITISYKKLTTVINITLEERKPISVTTNPSQLSKYLKEFEYSDITLEVLYNDNSVEEYPLTKEYLEKSDIILLGKAGTYEIPVTFEDVSTTFKIELFPNEVLIEDLDMDVVVYCITKKVGDVYQSVFYALGNKDFSGLQFKLSKTSKVTEYKIINLKENVFVNEEALSVSFASSQNQKGTIELFTIEFTSDQQYRNFNNDFDMDTKVVYIDNGEVKALESVLFTFTR